ncbi:sodium/glutamate symporter [Paraburkholderia sp. MMS20-SJTN17]|uniref:Sodium/glutamate symporter n=1 Tax=Paraburkholderia translucens TaxID=2886945 RepID=A0ABS8KGT3_9BURK|nr:sodium/glutamate symporter [Paraburkholderia sp. MMS20-SJTN17]MCC8403983.1 sodium/glutamate symporter [Paraburkholderia sp. MMS20-SJTN17]
MTIGLYATLVATSLVLLLGEKLVQWVGVLRTYSIPAPVAGGLIVAIGVLITRLTTHVEVKFDSTLQAPLMLAFFSTIGLNAHLSSLKAGGPVLVRFLALVSGLLILQNVLGLLLAFALGVDPLLGILGGSVTLSGGHGTGAAWSQVFTERHGLESATEIAIGCATFGLVIGGVLGGPLARLLLRRISAEELRRVKQREEETLVFEEPEAQQATTPAAIITTLALISICLAGGELFADWIANTPFELPTFVCVLFIGVILNNALSLARVQIDQHAVALVGNVALALFLAMALMRLDLWELAALAVPIISILVAQTVLTALYVSFITFRVMGRNYDAVVLCAAQCGLGMGATPTAIANMQAITSRFGHSHVAFLIVPMTGAFFMDIVNAIVIKLFLALPLFH